MEYEYLTVGVVTSAHALRGEVKVFPRTDFPETRFRAESKLFLRKPGMQPHLELVVRTARQHKNLWIIGFEGHENVTEVESWRGMEICVHQSQLNDLPEGTYYVHQLIGLTVKSDDGRELGTLVDVLKPGANDVYVVRGPVQKADILLPAIPDCVLGVDLEERVMTVHLLPGLLDEDESETSK